MKNYYEYNTKSKWFTEVTYVTEDGEIIPERLVKAKKFILTKKSETHVEHREKSKIKKIVKFVERNRQTSIFD